MRMHWKCDIIMMFPINEQDCFIALLDILCDSDIIAIKLLYIRLLSGQDIDKHFPDFPGELLNYFIIRKWQDNKCLYLHTVHITPWTTHLSCQHSQRPLQTVSETGTTSHSFQRNTASPQMTDEDRFQKKMLLQVKSILTDTQKEN